MDQDSSHLLGLNFFNSTRLYSWRLFVSLSISLSQLWEQAAHRKSPIMMSSGADNRLTISLNPFDCIWGNMQFPNRKCALRCTIYLYCEALFMSSTVTKVQLIRHKKVFGKFQIMEKTEQKLFLPLKKSPVATLHKVLYMSAKKSELT